VSKCRLFHITCLDGGRGAPLDQPLLHQGGVGLGLRVLHQERLVLMDNEFPLLHEKASDKN
jgi:hypothetical protein